MTFCLGMRTHEGLIGIADTLITSGTVLTKGKKLTCIQHGRESLFLLTSGLRSVRDKAITYFEEDLIEVSTWWDEALRKTIKNLPGEWMDRVLAKLHLDT